MFKKLLHELYTILVYINYHLSKKKFHKFIFIHPPQSGGNTIDYFFKINFGLRNFKINNHLDFNIFDFLNDPSKYKLIIGHFPYEFAFRTNHKKEFFYFTSIRNPRDRYLSNYYRNKRDFEKSGGKFMSLEKFFKRKNRSGFRQLLCTFFFF